MNIYQISVRPRHRRYIFFVDSNYEYKDLYRLITHNQSLWGGRFNPIVPVTGGKIAKEYLDIIGHYDPDLVFYSRDVDPEMLKGLRLFNPARFVNLDEKPRSEEISGVTTFFFLSQFDAKQKVLLPDKYFPAEDILHKFYEMNFGLSDTPYLHEFEMSKNHVQVRVDSAFTDLNKTIHVDKPINFAALSKTNANTKVLRNLEHAGYNDFELVVAKDDTQTNDLFYYWNRGLYENKNLMYVTVDQLTLLSQDKFFGGVLYDQKGEHSIRVVSASLGKEEIEDIIEKLLHPIAFQTRFMYFDINSFPYEVLDSNGLYERNYGESVTTQLLVSDTGIIHIPKLSFGKNFGFLARNFALDIRISQEVSSRQQAVLFPLTTQSRYIVKDVPGRVLLSRNLSVFINSVRQETDVLKLAIPPFGDLVRQLIQLPVVDGETIENKIIHIEPNDASNRLKAFIKVFQGDFGEIYDYFSDRFWVDIFEMLTLSEKSAGDSLTFEELVDRALKMYESLGLDFVDRDKGWFNVENLRLGLKDSLTELTGYQVFFKGFKLKCSKCSSIFWYHVNEVRDVVRCRGCLEDFDLPIEPRFAYKLNDLIKNNIYATSKNRDGNLTVIRTLAIFSRGLDAFQYAPQLNLYDDIHSRKPFGDLDIVLNDKGKFVIGEAKHTSNGFFEDNMKSLKSLAELSGIIYPDKIVLAASEEGSKKLENAAKSLKRLLKGAKFIPEVKTMLLNRPDYWHIKSHRYFRH